MHGQLPQCYLLDRLVDVPPNRARNRRGSPATPTFQPTKGDRTGRRVTPTASIVYVRTSNQIEIDRSAQGEPVTVPTDVDRDAPVLVHHEIDIAAPLERVWRLHVEVGRCRSWQDQYHSGSSGRRAATGASFTWTATGSPFTSEVYALNEPHRCSGRDR